MRELVVGDIVTLKESCLGNDEGAEGVVIQQYFIGDKPGVQVIFENGEYDGFSVDEQAMYLTRTGHEPTLARYEFVNAMKLSRDFDEGRFNGVFN